MSIAFNFAGKVAFVTGAGSGMGLAAAEAFAASGAAVALVDANQDAAKTAAATIVARGQKAIGLVADVTDEEAIARAIDTTVSKYGSLDYAFNNAGIMIPNSDPAEEEASAFDRVTAVNLRGVWASMKHELRYMGPAGSGAIVNCSSIGGLVGGPERGSYHASKHGVIGLTKSAALKYGSKGVRVNAVCPGTIATPMVDRMNAEGALDNTAVAANTPIPRLGRPDEIAQAVLWLCSPGASYVTGVALPVDGGLAAQ